MKKQRERLDKRLVELGLADTRSKAQAMIMEGLVFVSGERMDKAGTGVSDDLPIEVKLPENDWVSRGAHKILRALEIFPLKVEGKVCMDVGASTGGFTEVLLQNGASVVYAIDVGYGQLHWRLRQDPRVRVMERTNARYLTPGQFNPVPEIAVMDASFISVRLILPVLDKILPNGGSVVSLIKPQFEAGKSRIGKGGVVRSPEIHREILREVADFLRDETDLGLLGCTYSPIRGPKGNIEFLFYMVKGASQKEIDIDGTVAEIHGKEKQ